MADQSADDSAFPGHTRREERLHPQSPGEAGQPAGIPGLTWREDVAGRGPSSAEPGSYPESGPFPRLPTVLAEQFELVRQLPVQGAESDVLLVRDKAGTDLIVKIFRPGYRADPAVWQKLAGLTSAHVIRILQTGTAGGRDYEVMEYLGGGNLRGLAPVGRPMASEQFAAIVRQLCNGLACLHASGIVHRDLKPENVLVRSSRPLELAITDFGLSRALEESLVFASSSRTLAYAAPESLANEVSPARDWWSLGMMMRELATGQRPFSGMTETAVLHHLATLPIDTSSIADPRIQLLCRGLLTRDPRRRWGLAEVEAWLDGGSPAVAAPEDPRDTLTGLPFGGQLYTDRRTLAAALIHDWPAAATRFFSVTHTRSGPSEAWRTLRRWLGQFNDPRRDDVEGRIELIDHHLAGDAPPDIKLLHLIRWLDPSLPPHFLGYRVTAADLPRLAAAALDPQSPDYQGARALCQDLWLRRVLPVLARFADSAELAGIDGRWRELARDWNELRGDLRRDVPAGPRELLRAVPASGKEPPDLLLDLLALAADPDGKRASLVAAAERARAAVTEPVPWFDSAVAAARKNVDPLRLLAVTLLAPQAAAEAEKLAAQREQTTRAAALARQRWEEQERSRLAGRDKAVRRAVRVCLLLIPVLGVGALADGRLAVHDFHVSSGSAVYLAWIIPAVFAILAWAGETVLEVHVAKQQGTDYLPQGAWPVFAAVTDRFGRLARGTGRAVSGAAGRALSLAGDGCLGGCLGCLGLIVLVAALSALAYTLAFGLFLVLDVCLVAVPAVHAAMAAGRMRRWRTLHDEQKLQVTQASGQS